MDQGKNLSIVAVKSSHSNKMIKYSLRCNSQFCKNKPSFDGWFKNIIEFDKQKDNGLVNCPYCGGSKVIKNLMSPSIQTSKKNEVDNLTDNKRLVTKKNIQNNKRSNTNLDQKISTDEAMTVLRTLKKEIKDKAEYVGDKFVEEARDINSGTSKKRAIYGNASQEKVQELSEEGIQVLSIPWVQDDN